MKILYFDCFSGISGDMTLGALLDLGIDISYLINELKKLSLDGWDLVLEKRNKNGIEANYVKVVLESDHKHDHDHKDYHHDHDHRKHSDIIKIIDDSSISQKAKKISKDIFALIAAAEGKIHGKSPDDVAFHEVGALDSIIDIVGSAVCIDYLNPDKILSSAINDGHGFTYCQHGKIPVPVPAVMEIFSRQNVPFNQIDIAKELVTPTGAAIIAVLSESFGLRAGMQVVKTGYGAGTRDLEIPNVLRVQLCETSEQDRENITIIETNIDDCSPEILGYAMDKLLQANAKDVFFTNIIMKKNRPAVKLTVLCDKKDTKILTNIIFSQTTTIGLRIREENRVCLERQTETINTPYGELNLKKVRHNGTEKFSVEYEEAKLSAESHNVTLQKVYDFVNTLKCR